MSIIQTIKQSINQKYFHSEQLISSEITADEYVETLRSLVDTNTLPNKSRTELLALKVELKALMSSTGSEIIQTEESMQIENQALIDLTQAINRTNNYSQFDLN
jgi:hypothetical protein